MKSDLISSIENIILLFWEDRSNCRQKELWMMLEDEMEYELLCLINSYPRYYFKDYKEKLEEKYGETNFNPYRKLRKNKLWTIEEKISFNKTVNYRSMDIENLIFRMALR